MSHFSFSLLCFTSALIAAPSFKEGTIPSSKTHETFRSFTGKIAANKVRLRIKPDLESHILRQVEKNDLFLIIGEEGDFYAVEPQKNTKAYVFRSYILDDRVEVNRVNIRLEPHPDAPIIGQLKEGDKVKGQICPMFHKWLEIPIPEGIQFYVSKEYVLNMGGPELFASLEKRKLQVEEQLHATFLAAEAECKKPFVEMSPQPLIDKLEVMIQNCADFPDKVISAKEALALLKETYLNKKIAYLESKAELSPEAKAELLEKHRSEHTRMSANAPVIINQNLWSKKTASTLSSDFHIWDALEESLYLSWSAFHTGKKMDDFYLEQVANASVLTGTVEAYADAIKDRPGDFLLSTKDHQIVYLYSTRVDLNQYIGKTATLLVAPRPNNHFAFPAYFVLSVE
ncbi:MAG TPA: SH3 domain-containing protein [Chlamydiales bacterium]|nr:SH3 domain-containing protein [Chlamydiales bacterium]